MTLTIKLTKGRDGRDVLSCTRPDGTATWQHLPNGLATHDLTHYAVETNFQISDAFFGLLAKGYDISSFESAKVRKELPNEALLVEYLVNQLLLEAATAIVPDATEFNSILTDTLVKQGGEAPSFRDLTEYELGAIRSTARSLWSKWTALQPGDTIELSFDVPDGSGAIERREHVDL